jgi:hypothetical protein
MSRSFDRRPARREAGPRGLKMHETNTGAATRSGLVDGLKKEAGPFVFHLATMSGFLWAMIGLARRDWNRYVYLLREDGAFESLTSCFFLLSSAMCCWSALGWRRRGRTKLGVAFWLGAAFFFFLGMEEISWGQRVFKIQTPAALSAVNEQNELNLHNISGLHGTNEVRALLVVSAYGVVSGLLLLLANRRAGATPRRAAAVEALRMFTVPLRYTPYFLQMFVYILLRRSDSEWLRSFPQRGLIKELTEFLFALGCYLVLFFRLRTEILLPPVRVESQPH